jgi:tripartite-type tricarboxylate transporter receptor subunit TctC
LVFGTQGTHGTNSILFKDVRFDPFKDFEPITMVADAPLILVVNPKMPVNNVNELVSYVKKQPAGLDYASASSGGGAHIAGEMFAKAANLKLVHVPYKGSGPARTDLIAGHISFMFDNIGSSLPSARSGQLRALAVTGAKRTPSAPELPTMAEAGIDGVVIDTWYAIYAPAGTPASIVQKLNTEIVRVLKLPQVIARFKTMGLDIVAGTSSELASRMKSDVGRYAKTIADAGIKVD